MDFQYQLFDQFLEDRWSADPCESKPTNTSSDSCPNYTWLNQYNSLAFDFEDLQSFGDLESCNLSSPPEFALPSPISDASSLTAEDLFDQNSFIDPWLMPTAFENNASIPAAPCNSPSISAPSVASSPSSSESNSSWEADQDVGTKKSSKPPVTTRTGKGKNQPSDTSRAKPTSPIGKRQTNSLSHNLIEKRYRNNLNTKINALRESIPSLSSAAKDEEGEDAMDSDAGERRKAQKCNKGIILDTAIQYIAELENEVQRLKRTNSRLQMIVKDSKPNYIMVGC